MAAIADPGPAAVSYRPSTGRIRDHLHGVDVDRHDIFLLFFDDDDDDDSEVY
jgi:hypothetical protein